MPLIECHMYMPYRLYVCMYVCNYNFIYLFIYLFMYTFKHLSTFVLYVIVHFECRIFAVFHFKSLHQIFCCPLNMDFIFLLNNKLRQTCTLQINCCFANKIYPKTLHTRLYWLRYKTSHRLVIL